VLEKCLFCYLGSMVEWQEIGNSDCDEKVGMMKIRQSVLAITFAGLIGFPFIAVAAPSANQGPVFDPVTKSYFELRVDNKRGGKKPNWQTAVGNAARLYHDGRRGRLAVIKDQETLKFIRNNFKVLHETWIGLRFYCQFRKLIWVTGEIQPLSDRSLWHPQWYRNADTRCSAQTVRPGSYMPIYLTPESKGSVSWQASISAKFFDFYMVEYPAPAAPEKKNEEKAER
jgi:hypothetical protein